MKIFLSYASADKDKAEPVAFSLRARGYQVFLDKDDLPAGASYEQQIEAAIEQSDIFVFLISPTSIANGRFTMTELAWARKKWLAGDRRVLPVMIALTPLAEVPGYLKAVTILEPMGNLSAEVGAAVFAMTRGLPVATIVPMAAMLGLASGLLTGFLPNLLPEMNFGVGHGASDISKSLNMILINGSDTPLHAGFLLAAALAWPIWKIDRPSLQSLVVLMLSVVFGWLLAVNLAYQLVLLVDPVSVKGAIVDLQDSHRASIETVVDIYSRIVWSGSGVAAGLVGALLTYLGARRASARLRNNNALVLTVFAGAACGALLSDNLIPPKVLYAVWQTAVAAAIGYGLSKPIR